VGNNKSVAGIVIGDGSKENVVRLNTISNNGAHGIHIGVSFFNHSYNSYPERNLIPENKIINNNDGIFLVYTHNNTIEKNIISIAGHLMESGWMALAIILSGGTISHIMQEMVSEWATFTDSVEKIL